MTTPPTTSLESCSRLLAELAVTLRVTLDGPQYRTYHRVLARVPLPLLRRAVTAAAAACVHFPKPAELLRLAEQERGALLTAHPFLACDACTLSPGWREVVIDGVTRLARCACYRAWQQRLADLGAGVERLVPTLPPAPARELVLDYDGEGER